MKILHVINNLATGGAEKLLLDSIPKYTAQGMTVDLLVLNGVAHPFFVDFQKNTQSKLFWLGKHSIYNPIHIFKLVKYLKRYDIVHVHLFPSLYWVGIARMLAFSSVKLVYTEHSTRNRRNNSFIFRLIDNLVYTQYCKIICVSEDVAQQMDKKLNPPESKLITIENGIDLSRIKAAAPYSLDGLGLPLPDDAKIVLQVSSFQYPKDQKTVIRSLQHLPENVHLLLAGTGPLETTCKMLARQLSLEHRVHFLGVRMDVPQLLKTADLIVLSSEFEGLSLSCIEGMASGKPFIASDVPGLQEIIGGAGLTFPLFDEKSLAEIIVKLNGDAQFYAEIARRCQQKAKQYDIGITVQKHISVYRDVYAATF